MLERLLQVRRGEWSRAVLLFSHLFLVVSGYIVTKSARDSLFLQHFSTTRLPFADIASALSVAVALAIYLRVSRRAGPRPLLIGTLASFSIASAGFWVATRFGQAVWPLPVLYIWASVSGVLLPAQVWTLANYVLTTREAKRLFAIIGSGAICGGIVGGLVSTMAPRLGTENLLLVPAATFAVCPFLVAMVWRERKLIPSEGPSSRRVESKGLVESLGLIRRSPHLRSIAALVLLATPVTTIVAWQFKALAKAFIPETDALTAFFGTFNSWTGAAALVTQLLLTSRILRRYGIGVALLIVPVALTTGSIAVLVAGTLGAAVLLKGSDQVLRYSIERATFEMLYLPVPSGHLGRAKACIDAVVYRSGDALGSLIVLAGVTVFGVTAAELGVVSLLMLVAWIVVAVSAGRQYVENLRRSIYEHRIDAERLAPGQAGERATIQALVDALGSDEPDDVLYALSLLEDQPSQLPRDAVRRLFDHPVAEVRRRAIALFAAADDAGAVERADDLLRTDPDAGVRSEALLYLTRVSDIDPLIRLSELDRVHAASMASAIAQFLTHPGPRQNLEAARLLLDVALEGEGPEGVKARLEAARVVASLPDCFNEHLSRLLRDLVPDVARLAIRAVAAVGRTESAPLVVARLADPDLLTEATSALTSFGDRAIPALVEALADEQAPAVLRHVVPDVLQRIGTPAAEHALVEHLLDPDPLLRLRVISALNKLRQLNPERRLEGDLIETVLSAEILGHYRSYQLLGKLSVEAVANDAALQAVKESMARELERIFRLIKLLYPEHDLHSAYVGLQSGNAVVHANAVEFLEHALPAQFRKLLMPLVDVEVGLAERIKLAERMVGAAFETSDQALAAFSASADLLRDAAENAERQLGVDASAREE